MTEVINTLRNVRTLMDELYIKGRDNHAILTACCDDLSRTIKLLEGRESDAHSHTESRVEQTELGR